MIQFRLTVGKATLVVSYLVSVAGMLYFFIAGSFGAHYHTPFTCSLVLVLLFWLVEGALQLLFLVKSFFNINLSNDSQASILTLVGPHFSLNNVLNFFWCYFFAKQNFGVAELILVANLINLSILYFVHKTWRVKSTLDWLLIHFPVTALPFAWTLYALFWNGACFFHSHYDSFLERLLANIFIWVFFVVPGAFIIFQKDWSISISTSFLLLGVGVRQLLDKTVGVQWIFALVISGLDFVAAILCVVDKSLNVIKTNNHAPPDEEAPLLS